MQRKKNSLSRDQAMELYDDLEKAMSHLMGSKGEGPKPVSKPQAAKTAYQQRPTTNKAQPGRSALQQMLHNDSSITNGKSGAIALLTVVGILKISTALIDASGVFAVPQAQASLTQAPQVVLAQNPKFSAEERKLLTALDERRSAIEERSARLDQREKDLERRDQDFATRLTELREMTGTLKIDREKNDKKKSTQIEQLANVYGSMDPKEAAGLIEQLDIQISLALLQKMPEKRIAQILALMSPERALAITRLLSGGEALSAQKVN